MSPPGDHCFRGCRILPLPVLMLGGSESLPPPQRYAFPWGKVPRRGG